MIFEDFYIDVIVQEAKYRVFWSSLIALDLNVLLHEIQRCSKFPIILIRSESFPHIFGWPTHLIVYQTTFSSSLHHRELQYVIHRQFALFKALCCGNFIVEQFAKKICFSFLHYTTNPSKFTKTQLHCKFAWQ